MTRAQMSHSLKSLNGGHVGDDLGQYYGGHHGGYWEFRP